MESLGLEFLILCVCVCLFVCLSFLLCIALCLSHSFLLCLWIRVFSHALFDLFDILSCFLFFSTFKNIVDLFWFFILGSFPCCFPSYFNFWERKRTEIWVGKQVVGHQWRVGGWKEYNQNRLYIKLKSRYLKKEKATFKRSWKVKQQFIERILTYSMYSWLFYFSDPRTNNKRTKKDKATPECSQVNVGKFSLNSSIKCSMPLAPGIAQGTNLNPTFSVMEEGKSMVFTDFREQSILKESEFELIFKTLFWQMTKDSNSCRC